MITNIQNDKIDSEYKLSLKSLENHYNIFMYEKSLDANKIYNSIQNNTPILKLLDSLSKKQNINTTKNLKKLLNEIKILNNTDINDLQFISSNNIILFNYFSNNNLFYDIQESRLDIINVNNIKSKSYGYHSGILKNGFRYLYPLYIKINNKDKFIGVLDISYSSNLLQYF